MDMKKSSLLGLIGLVMAMAMPTLIFAAGPTAPQITSPDNNATTTIEDFVGDDITWNATTTVGIEYQVEVFYNNLYVNASSTSSWIDEKSIGVDELVKNPGEGIYYLRVRAKDATGTGVWSNDKKNPYRVIVGIMPLDMVLAEKAQCQLNDGWKSVGVFKSLGQCVSFYNQQLLGHIQNFMRIINEKKAQLIQEVQNTIKTKQAELNELNKGQTKKIENTEGNGNGNSNGAGNGNNNGNGNANANASANASNPK